MTEEFVRSVFWTDLTRHPPPARRRGFMTPFDMRHEDSASGELRQIALKLRPPAVDPWAAKKRREGVAGKAEF